MSIRNRVLVAVASIGALGLAGPVAIASAQTGPSIPTPIVAAAPIVQPTLPAGVQLGLQAAQSGWQQGLQAAEGGWAPGAQAAQSGFAAGAAALGIPGPVAPGIL